MLFDDWEEFTCSCGVLLRLARYWTTFSCGACHRKWQKDPPQ
jgi:hypothetical protein